PDVTYQDCTDVAHYGPVGAIHGYAIGSATCNIGDQDLFWTSHNTPALAMNAFRLNNGRFEQIGLGFCKTACCAGAGSGSGSCNKHGGNVLGAGCKDVYGGGFNGGPGALAPRSVINAFTGSIGAFAGGGPSPIDREIQINEAEMSSTTYPNALYFVEGAYI